MSEAIKHRMLIVALGISFACNAIVFVLATLERAGLFGGC